MGYAIWTELPGGKVERLADVADGQAAEDGRDYLSRLALACGYVHLVSADGGATERLYDPRSGQTFWVGADREG